MLPSSPSPGIILLFFALAGLTCAPAKAAIDSDAAAKIFQEAKAISDRDSGAFWGRALYGPILLVDPVDRSIIANQVDAGGQLKPLGGLFAGVLPESEIIANTPLSWSGTGWTELLWPLPEDVVKRHVMLTHEMFHRIQSELKLTRPDIGNQHLDTLEGRYLLQMEWRALAKALRATSSADRSAATADALLFRQERYRLFPKAPPEERALEINEGVPEYTGVRLGLETSQERIDYAVRDLSAFVDSPSFVRSFAYATGPAYGLLLDEVDGTWRSKLGSGQGLDQLLSTGLQLSAATPVELKLRENAYDDGSLRASETKRDQERSARLALLQAKLVDGPVLTLSLRAADYQFNPQTLQSLGNAGMVFPTLRVSGKWGVHDVEGSALVDKDMTVVSVSAAGITPTHLENKEWRLTLKKGWTVAPGARKGDLVLKQTESATP